jgi:tetratricopeptide (TPR) repeat protein
MTSNNLLLHHLAGRMLEQQNHILPVDELFDDDLIADFVKSIQIDSPYQQMLLEGVLTESVRDEKLYVSFTVEGYFHFVLGEVIYKQTEGLGAEALKQIIEGNKLNGSKEGVEQCLIRDVEKNDLTRLMCLIDQIIYSQFDLNLFLVPIKISFNILGVEYVLDKLLQFQSQNDWKIIDRIFDSNYFSVDIYNNIGQFIIQIKQFEYQVAQKVLGKAILNLQNQEEKLKLIEIYKKYVLYNNGILASQDDLDKLSIMAKFYEKNRLYGSWLSCIDDCLKYELKYFGEQHKFTANSYNQKGLVYLSDDFNRNITDAIKYFRISYEINCNKYSSESIELATGEHNLGLAYLYNSSLDESESFLIESLNKRKKIFGSHSLQFAETLAVIGVLYKEKSDYYKAEVALKDSLKIVTRLNSKDFWFIGNTQNNLGDLYFKTKKYEEALKHYFLSLENLNEFYRELHFDLSRVAFNIGNVYAELDDSHKALAYYMEAWNIGDKIFLENISHPFDVVADNIASYYIEMDNFEKAISYYEKSLTIRLKFFGDQHPDTGISFSNIAAVYCDNGDYDKAIGYFEKSLAINLKVHGDLHPQTGSSCNKLGFTWSKKGDFYKAIFYYKKSLMIDLEIQGCPKLNQYYSIGDCLQKMNKFEVAISNYEKGFIFQQAGGFPFRIAECYLALGKTDIALKYLIQSAEIRKGQLGIEDENTRSAIQKSKELALYLNQYEQLPKWIKEFKDDL